MDNGSLWDNVERSNPHRDETCVYVQDSLGLTRNQNIDRLKSINTTIQSFETVGTAICKAYNYGQSNAAFPKPSLDAGGSS